jgi:hypothetical protein
MQKIIRKTIQRVLENYLSRELYIEREDFLEVAPAKFFRLSIGNEVRLKMRISSKQNLLKDSEALLLKSMLLMTMLVVVVVEKLRNVK